MVARLCLRQPERCSALRWICALPARSRDPAAPLPRSLGAVGWVPSLRSTTQLGLKAR